jgi:hypothetical protein
MSELLVPEVELAGVRLATLHALEEAVPLLKHAGVALHGAQVSAVHLGDHHVQVAAAEERQARDHLDIQRGEEDCGELANRLGSPLGHAVDADALPARWLGSVVRPTMATSSWRFPADRSTSQLRRATGNSEARMSRRTRSASRLARLERRVERR